MGKYISLVYCLFKSIIIHITENNTDSIRRNDFKCKENKTTNQSVKFHPFKTIKPSAVVFAVFQFVKIRTKIRQICVFTWYCEH